MSCRRATQLISESMDRPLTRRERVALRVHIVICGSCRRYRRQLARLRTALERLAATSEMATAEGAPAVLSPEARTRIRDALRSVG
ncbi:MAG: zf-HC2 domain-containing protein [Phycisphaerales bacterium]|nr:zf-HC2 domain-containing protein [Phycisphaerales bacterium]